MISVVDTAWELISLFGVFVIGLVFMPQLGRWFGVRTQYAIQLYLWHSFFCGVYIAFSIMNGADSIMYFLRSEYWNETPFMGTPMVVAFTSILTQGLGLSYGGCFFVYNIIGTIGLMAFSAALGAISKGKTRKVRRIATIIPYLPGLSFWSTAIGKDSIAFFGVGLICWAAASPYRRFFAILIGIAMIFAVRPHIAAILIATLALTFSFTGKISLPLKLLINVILIPASIAVSILAVGYIGLEEVSTDNAISYMQERQNYNTTGGSSVDIANSSVPMRMFTYGFRPLVFDAGGAFGLIASLENLVILGIVLGFTVGLIKRPSNLTRFQLLFFSLYVILSWLILANTTANLGIAIRQKTMFSPMLILIAFSYFPNTRPSVSDDMPLMPSSRRERA